MAIFTGAGVAIVTPFKEDESIDYDRLDELIDFHCENGTDSIVICGTSGEAATMTEREHMECVKFTVERTKGRIPVIAGSGSNCTKTAMELSKEAAGYGVDGVLVVTPYYNKATQKGMISHFTQVADAAKVPVVLYNIPGRTGCKMEAETVAYLVNNVDNIVAIKEASGDFSNIVKMMELTDGKLDLYSGNDDQIVPLDWWKRSDLRTVECSTTGSTRYLPALSGRKGERKPGTAVKGIAVDSCIILRSESNSCEESSRTDGTLRWNGKSAAY